jgi:hypothetical protein
MRFNILAIFAAALLYALTNASPLPQRPPFRPLPQRPPFRPFANNGGKAGLHLYRNGNAKTPVNKMREQDWKMKDGLVHPSTTQGLSLDKDPKKLGPGHKWSLLRKDVKNHPQFKAVHDGPEGHVNLAFHGKPAPAAEVHQALLKLPWKHEGKK